MKERMNDFVYKRKEFEFKSFEFLLRCFVYVFLEACYQLVMNVTVYLF